MGQVLLRGVIDLGFPGLQHPAGILPPPEKGPQGIAQPEGQGAPSVQQAQFDIWKFSPQLFRYRGKRPAANAAGRAGRWEDAPGEGKTDSSSVGNLLQEGGKLLRREVKYVPMVEDPVVPDLKPEHLVIVAVKDFDCLAPAAPGW